MEGMRQVADDCGPRIQADFLRNGTAKGIMSLSKEDSTKLWKAVQDRMSDWKMHSTVLL